MKYIGIDLGTVNTYIFQTSCKEEIPEAVLIPELGDESGSMATAVLYENGSPFLAGNVAEAEYYTQPDLQQRRRLATQFKPEIGLAVAGALEATKDFLSLVRQNLPDGLLDDARITVGIPSLAREDFHINLRDCFEKAGWPKPVFVRESDAALVSCLQAGVIHTSDISRKCLILDFGGGTCDYSSVESLDILQSGGDILYGGRLFDDLFYQAFCRSDPDFADAMKTSPYAWYAHWIQCRKQKEKFSDQASRNREALQTLRITWHDANGNAKEAFLRDYSVETFMRDAENFHASSELLEVLSPYESRGGLSAQARDLLAGREVGLISWLRQILENVDRKREVASVILTGGSSRWFFVTDLAREIFTGAKCLNSKRGYEDIAFGLALFPLLLSARDKAAALLKEKLGIFTGEAVAAANAIVARQSAMIAKLCSDRIVERDVMPVLEEAQKQSMTVIELESKFSENIEADSGLLQIAREHSDALRLELEKKLNLMFRSWLRENGVPLVPTFEFPARSIGNDFFESVSVRISRLDSLNLMSFTLQNILPVLAATATAGAIAHSGEPISIVIGGGAVFAGTWLAARAAPGFMKQRKLPSFILNESNRKKIVESNREHIEKSLLLSLAHTQQQIGSDIEMKIKESLKAMLASLTALNQVATE